MCYDVFIWLCRSPLVVAVRSWLAILPTHVISASGRGGVQSPPAHRSASWSAWSDLVNGWETVLGWEMTKTVLGWEMTKRDCSVHCRILAHMIIVVPLSSTRYTDEDSENPPSALKGICHPMRTLSVCQQEERSWYDVMWHPVAALWLKFNSCNITPSVRSPSPRESLHS